MQYQKNNLYNNLNKSNRNNPPEYEYGEMVYTDPNINQIPTDSQEQIFFQKEPMEDEQREIPFHQTFGKNMKSKQNASKYMQEQPFPSNNEEELNDRTPKYVINTGSSGDDYEYRMPTFPRKSQNYQNINNEKYDGNQYEDEDYQEYQNESEIPKTDIYPRKRRSEEGNIFRNNSPTGYGEVIPLNRMSPLQTFDEFNTSTDKNVEQNYTNLTNNQLYNSMQPQYHPRQEYVNPNQTLKNPSVLNILRDEVSHKYNNQTYNNMSYKDIKKIANRFSKVYDPHKNKNGILVEESQITLPGAQDEVFNNRYKVLSKMNRLSNILLANKNKKNSPKRTENNFNTKTYNRNNSYNDNKKGFDRHTLARSPDNGINRKAFSRSPNHRFLYVSLAMVSSKGPSTEDRPILRWMRLEKGGVVDLAQEEKKKNKFQIKKAAPKKGLNKRFYTNPKYREKAAKIIQNWWRDLKNVYNDRLTKIIKIQSAFRGKFVRKYMYDLFYLNFLYISFCKKIENVLGKHVRPLVWDELFKKPEGENNIPEKENKLQKIVSRDYRNDKNSLIPAWKKWVSTIRKLNIQNSKGRNLVQIRSNKENKLNELRNALHKWKYVKKILDAQDKLLDKEKENEEKNLEKEKQNEKDKENNLEKIKGLFNLVDGLDKFVKKESLNQTLPKLENYLKGQKGKGKLRKIVNKKPNYEKNLLRKYFYRWLGKCFNKNETDEKDLDKEPNEEVEKLKNKIIKNIIVEIKLKQHKNILRKYLYKWLKKTILMAIKEEREKLKNKEKEFKNKEFL